MIDISTGSLVLRTDAPGRLEREIERLLSHFRAEPRQPSAQTVRIKVSESADVPPFGDSVDVSVQRLSGGIVDFESMGARARFNELDLTLDMQLRLEPLECARGAWENIVRRVVQTVLLRGRRGALFHAASFDLDGAGLLAVGPSGRGKSTLAANAARLGCRVFSDDLSWVDSSTDGPRLCGSPFFGLEDGLPRRPGSSPLRAVLVLEQSENPTIEPLSRARAMSHLALNLPFCGGAAFEAEETMDHLEALVRNVPVRRLRAERRGDKTLDVLRRSLRT